MTHRSIYDLLRDRVAAEPDGIAALVRRDGRYTPVTWEKIEEEVRAISRGLLALGLQPGDRVCIIAETGLAWVTADLGVVGAGGVTVPIYTAEMPDGVRHVAADSGAVMVFAGDATQVRKLEHERPRLPAVRRVIQLDGQPAAGDGWVLGCEELKQRGAGETAEPAARRRTLDGDAVATIIYTAGTTGPPKGVVLTHDNLLYEAEATASLDLVTDADTQLIYLPLAHSLGKVLVIFWLATGHLLAFAESPATVMQNLLEVRPTLMAGAPRLFERIYGAIAERALAAGSVTDRFFAAAAGLSVQRGEAESRGASLGTIDRLALAALRPLFFDRVGAAVKEALGGRMRLMISGAAPLSARITWFLRDAGLTVLEGYGLTETSAAATVNRPGRWRIGSVGLPLPGTSLRIGEDGEILVQGRGVMREYWRDPAATHAVLDADGWLHTGDIGHVDGDGYLHITDRKKDIIVTAGGKNVSPQNIESRLQAHPLISHVVVHGDRRKYLSALVTVDAVALRKLAAERGLGNASYAELTQELEVRRAVEQIVAELNDKVASFEAIRRFKILEHDFSVEAGELSPSQKTKRRVIYERYRSIFDGFYDEAF